MRNVPSSVAVVTVLGYDAELKRNVPMGVAVSSLSTVTLDPPTISFNIKEPSKTLEAIRAAKGLFRVHFPAADRGGAAMVDLFSRGNHPDAYDLRAKELRLHVPGTVSFAEKLQSSPSLAPQILNDSVRAAMECTLTHELSVADHVILVAKVEKMESKRPGDRTILYVDGQYMRPDGSRVGTQKFVTASTQDTWSIWNYPLFPGEEERRAYMERIKAIVKEQPKLLQSGHESFRELEFTLPISPGAWGINLEQLLDECRRETGMPSKLVGHLQHLPVLSDFYGRLSPSDRAVIVERAKKLITADPNSLSVNFRFFLHLLGVGTASIDLLPSDLAEPLRADGLLKPFVPRTQNFSSHRGDYHLQYLEQVEHRIVERFAAIGHEAAVTTQLAHVMESLGEQKQIATYFKKCRARMYAAASPELFDSSKIDISGDASPEEARVIMSRLTRFIQSGDLATMRRHMHQDSHETLRSLGIHPSITGIDIEFFFGKIKYLYLTTRTAREMARRVDEMLDPWFDTTITWQDLDKRVKNFVETMPMRAMSWSTRERLAAIGVAWRAVLDLPSPAEQQSLRDGHILDTIVAKELNALYERAPEDLSQTIASYLKEHYDFDINRQWSSDQASSGALNDGTDSPKKLGLSRRPTNLTGPIRYTSGFTNPPDFEQKWDGLTERRKKRIQRGHKLGVGMAARKAKEDEVE